MQTFRLLFLQIFFLTLLPLSPHTKKFRASRYTSLKLLGVVSRIVDALFTFFLSRGVVSVAVFTLTKLRSAHLAVLSFTRAVFPSASRRPYLLILSSAISGAVLIDSFFSSLWFMFSCLLTRLVFLTLRDIVDH